MPSRIAELLQRKDEKIVEEINLGGFKYLAEQQKWVRILWLSVIILFLILTFYQIWTQIARYMEHPISTNVDVQYPEKITFPGIALCNNNQFRLSYLYDPKVREWALPNNTIHSKDAPYFEQVIDSVGNWSAIEFLQNSTHEITTMLASCTLPNGTKCTPKMWRQYWTIDGICWALNLDNETPIEVTNSGSSHGLRLVLNTESYEHAETCGRVNNDQEEAGFRVLLFDRSDRPITTSDGVSVSPGMSVNIPYKIKHRVKLPGPSCREETEQSRNLSNLMSPDNLRACMGRSMHEKFEEHCNCSIRRLYTGGPRQENECNVETYFNCVLPYQRRLQANLSAEIGQSCLAPCDSMEYTLTQDISGIPKNLMPKVSGNSTFYYEQDTSEIGAEKYLIGVDGNGKRLYKEVTHSCGDSAFVSKEFATETLRKVLFVINWRSRLNVVERKDLLNLKDQYFEQKLDLSDHGWPVQESDIKPYSIGEYIIEYEQDCNDIIKIWKNNSDLFPNLQTIELMIKKKSADFVNWELLRNFHLDRELQRFLDGEISKYTFAEYIKYHSYVYFFHQEFQRYWIHPIQDFLYEARLLLRKEKNELKEILKRNFGDNENNTSDFTLDDEDIEFCIDKRLPQYVSEQFDEFREMAEDFAMIFNELFRDHFGDYYKNAQINAEFEKQNLAIVNIYLQSNAIETWTQQEEYPFWTLACDAGGALGLYLGASVVTLLEIVYVLWTRYKIGAKQMRREAKMLGKVIDNLEMAKRSVVTRSQIEITQ
ncbi:unnamed protein product, partial [Mesorhabditis belari]|uniref:Uncharacterized protein n=1 Tax=Mesorhabditis belari TaxID=2138241 RepID=A0AAF3EE69_9BILA